ncbi:cob(I)yrinic acid a,c-diamide adenosyltransferase [Candidatus Peregrinibacteria bacterium]|nr:cob(I)yrinic acid a,c-diamide adenosyltransferase [Candidatus Peregrinibacteria bacterium]
MTVSVVTKRGDKGTTDLFGKGRIPKDSIRLHAEGTIDELNAILGLVLAEKIPTSVRRIVEPLQHTLFRAGADLATPISITPINTKRIRGEDIECLERQISALESTLPPQQSFLLPKGNRSSCLLHQARTVCRRAERWTVALSHIESVNPALLVYLNRLGDYLFIATRTLNRQMNIPEEPVRYS